MGEKVHLNLGGTVSTEKCVGLNSWVRQNMKGISREKKRGYEKEMYVLLPNL